MTVKTTAILVDDIPTALDNLRETIADFLPEIEIVGEANGVVAGAKLIKAKQPTIAFLDIEMPDGTGFDILDLLPDDNSSAIIFTTGSEDYAIKAFRYAAVDYLLKPIDPDDLIEAVSKVKTSHISTKQIKEVLETKDENSQPTRIALHTAEEVIVTDIANIIRCQSLDNYCHVFLASGEKILLSKPLKHFSDLLSSADFIRTHQSHLVNFDAIHAYVKRDGGYLELKDGSHIPVSVRKRGELLERLEQIN